MAQELSKAERTELKALRAKKTGDEQLSKGERQRLKELRAKKKQLQGDAAKAAGAAEPMEPAVLGEGSAAPLVGCLTKSGSTTDRGPQPHLRVRRPRPA